MVIKITPQQAKRVNALLRKLCANYDGGNCLLLDDGEPCVCVQSISKYGIYCNYFKNAVLPVDEGLHAEIMKPTDGKRCVLCRQAFASRAKNQRYCPACAAKQKRLKAAERQRRKRASASRFYGADSPEIQGFFEPKPTQAIQQHLNLKNPLSKA